MARLGLTLALEHYDRHVPFFDGTVTPEDIELTAFHVGQVIPSRRGANRHERMIRDLEFDAAEVSLSSYLMAKDRGFPARSAPPSPVPEAGALGDGAQPGLVLWDLDAPNVSTREDKIRGLGFRSLVELNVTCSELEGWSQIALDIIRDPRIESYGRSS